jgi:uncharacterized protein
MIPLRESEAGISFAVRVQPRASRTAVLGVFGEGEEAALKLALSAPPVEGQANEALIRFFADLFSIPRSTIAIIGGAQSRNKLVRIAGVSEKQIRERLDVLYSEK